MIALWQAINYNNTYQTQTTITGGQFSVPAGTQITADSPLFPFYQDDQNLHSSKSVASIRNFGYTYPEINDWSMGPEDTKQLVIAKVNALYGNATSPAAKKRLRAPRGDGGDWGGWGQESWKEYYVQIGVERSELDLPCTIDVLLGDRLAGSVAVLSTPASGRTHSEVLLNRVLSKMTSCLEPDAVIPVLEQHFRVEIRKVRHFSSCLNGNS
jgi:tyrosinase